jgi:hypothetical protein
MPVIAGKGRIDVIGAGRQFYNVPGARMQGPDTGDDGGLRSECLPLRRRVIKSIQILARESQDVLIGRGVGGFRRLTMKKRRRVASSAEVSTIERRWKLRGLGHSGVEGVLRPIRTHVSSPPMMTPFDRADPALSSTYYPQLY